MIRLETREDFARARERLRSRDPEALVAFLMSLAGDSGPVGEQIRTFIVGDDLVETVESVRDRIGDLSIPSEYDHRHSRGGEMGKSLDFIVDSIERLVLPVDPKAAFVLLCAVFEADAVAMENCGEHDYEVSSAFERATELIAKSARSLPHREVETALQPLVLDDHYGVRSGLSEVIARRREEG